MGYYVANMIGIRTGGVFSGETDQDDLRSRIAAVVASLRDTDDDPDIADDPSHCLSPELTAHKGSMVVIAGVFNYWGFDRASVFAARLSEEFGTEVMLMSFDMERQAAQCQVFLAGQPFCEVSENPIGRVLRHVA